VLERLSIGIDIGGTKVAAGVVDVDDAVHELLHRETPSGSARDVEDTVAALVAELRRRHDVVAVGIGAAGFVDSARATVLFSPHLAWRHEPLRDAVHRRTGMSVVVENDANAAAWAEWRFGAAQNEPDLVCRADLAGPQEVKTFGENVLELGDRAALQEHVPVRTGGLLLLHDRLRTFAVTCAGATARAFPFSRHVGLGGHGDRECVIVRAVEDDVLARRHLHATLVLEALCT